MPRPLSVRRPSIYSVRPAFLRPRRPSSWPARGPAFLRALLRPFLRRVLTLAAILIVTAPGVVMGQDTRVSGIVLDEQDAPVVRAVVRLLDASGAAVGATLSDRDGRFAIEGACAGCRVEAALAGFLTASAPATATAGASTRLVLRVAPIRAEISVTANRDDVPVSQVGSSVTVFNRAEIERRGTPLVSELLRTAPGVTVVRTGGLGSVTSLFVRGGESNYNKVLLDGIPLNEPGGTFNFGSFTTSGLERVEIVRGAQSALFGSDAMASVVQLIPTRGRAGAPPAVQLEAEGGGYATTRVQAGVSGGLARWDYAISGSRYGTDNRAVNNVFEHNNVGAMVGGPIGAGDRLALRALVRVEDTGVGVPGQTAFGRPDADAFFSRRETMAGTSVTHQASAAWRQLFTVALSRSRQTSTNLIADPPYTPTFEGRTAPFAFSDFTYSSQNTFTRYHAAYRSDWTIGSSLSGAGWQVITAAVEWDGERGSLEDRLAGTRLTPSRDNVGVSVQSQWATDRLFATMGVRLEHNASFGNAFTPRASMAFRLRESAGVFGDTTIRASAGLGVKEPTLLQSYSLSPFARGNPDLLPERARSGDLGLEQRLFGQRAKIDLTFFDGRYRNQVGTAQSRYVNIGRTRARGTELGVEVAPMPGLGLRASHTFLASEIVEATSTFSPLFQAGRWTFRRPRHSGALDASLTRGRVTVDVSATFSGRRVDSDFSSLSPSIDESNPPALWMLGGRVQLSRRLEAYGRIENLTDADHMEPLGYLTWRRTAHGGLRVKF